MKIYFAGGVYPYSEVIHKYNGKVLLSFADQKSINNYLSKYPNKKIFLDSGAFTASTMGKEINIDDLISFIKRNIKNLEVYATLDVIGNWKATKENTKYMEKRGLKPLPVFHYKSPKEELIDLVKNYDYFGLGGLVPIAKDKKIMRSWLDMCFSIIQDKAKTHGFGVTALWALKRYPFYSTDSTSYLQASRYGSSKIIKNEKIIKFNNKTKHYLQRTDIEVEATIKMRNYITNLWKARGIDYEN